MAAADVTRRNLAQCRRFDLAERRGVPDRTVLNWTEYPSRILEASRNNG